MILIGMFGIVYNKNIFIKLLSLEVMNVGVVFLFVAMSHTKGSLPPIYTGEGTYADPIPQAVIITAIVIGFSILALSVSIVSGIVGELKRERVDDIERMMR